MKVELIAEEPVFDPAENLRRDAHYWEESAHNRARVWRNDRCVVLGRFLEPGREVYLHEAGELRIPVLKRASGGGAVYQDPGNLNYSLYLSRADLPSWSIEESLKALSYPVTAVLSSLGLTWEWVPPNNVYVEGKKISGSAQARRRDRLLHHGTLLISCDLDTMRVLLKPGGRSRMAPVINLAEMLPQFDAGEVAEMLAQAVTGTVARL